VIEFILGFSVVALLGYFRVVNQKLLKTKKIQVMDRQAHEDLVLDALRFLIAGGEGGDEENTGGGKKKVKKRSNDILIFLLKFEYGIDAIYKV
jgi:hypothetical protein